MSGIEIPDSSGDFYQAKDVPHGTVRIHPYYSKIQNATRRAFVYTPPGYTVVIPTDKWPVKIPSGVKSGALVAVSQQPGVVASAPLLLGADSCA